jgi:hypothetical protein
VAGSVVPELQRSLQAVPRQYQDLLIRLMLPELFGTFRANPGCATKETAVATCWQRLRTSLAQAGNVTGAGGADLIPITDSFALVFRNAALGAIVYFANPSGVPTTITLGTPVDATVAAGAWLRFASVAYAGGVNGFYNPVLDSSGNWAAWVDVPASNLPRSGSAYTATQTILAISGLGVSLPYTFLVRSEVNGVQVDVAYTNTTSAGGIWTQPLPFGSVIASGYKTIQYVSQGANLTAISPVVQYTVNSAVCQHMSMAQWNSFGTVADNVSINSVTAMWTNTTSELNRQGQVAQLQVAGGVDWPGLLNFASTGASAGGSGDIWLTLSELPSAAAREATNGCFSFLRPTSAAKSFTRGVTSVGSAGDPPTVPVTPSDDYLLLYLNIGTSTNAQTGYWTITHGAEYETEDLTRERASPPTAAIQFLGAMDASTRITQHYTNSFHLSDIIKGVAGTAGALIPGAAPLASLVSSLFE